MWIVLAFAAGVLLAIVVANLSSSSKKVERKIEHLYAVRRPAVRALDGHRCSGRRSSTGNRVTALLQRRRDLPRHARGDPRRREDRSRFETYIYWSGDDRAASSPTRCRERARAGREGPRAARLGGQQARWTRRWCEQMKDAGVEVERYHPLRWYNLGRINNRTHRKLLVVDGRIGFTGGVGHRRRLAGQRPGPGALARLALPARRPGGGADAGGVHGQLDQDPRRGPARRGLLPAARARSATHPAQVFRSSPDEGSESMRLMYLLVHRLGASAASASPAPTSCPTTWRCRRWWTRASAACTVEIIVPGPAHRHEARAPGVAARAGGRCSRRASRSTSTSRRCTTAR